MLYKDKDPTLWTYLGQVGLKTLGFDPGTPDNWKGQKTEKAYQDFLTSQLDIHNGVASIFADERDLAKFAECKKRGMTDLEAFKYGDNGIGASGKITGQKVTPMVALHPLDIRAKWGEMSKAWGKPILLTYKERTIVATLEDYMSAPTAIIDVNPAGANLLNFPPGGMVPVSWSWMT